MVDLEAAAASAAEVAAVLAASEEDPSEVAVPVEVGKDKIPKDKIRKLKGLESLRFQAFSFFYNQVYSI